MQLWSLKMKKCTKTLGLEYFRFSGENNFATPKPAFGNASICLQNMNIFDNVDFPEFK